jgi:glycosyltransferase involved in cell wall biosynthesis/SAM-dependent methyltransferase
MTSPRLNVVLCTFDRPDSVGRALAGLLATRSSGLEVIVADAGDAASTRAALAGFASDDRWRLVELADHGLTRLRNDGAALVDGAWLGFLDDDDEVSTTWVDAMSAAICEPGVGLVSCGAALVHPDTGARTSAPAAPLGPLMHGVSGNVLAGCWVVRRDVFDDAGGYLPGLMWSHQTELWLRMVEVCRQQGLRVVALDRELASIARRPPSDRRLVDPRLLLDGTRWILARHPAAFERAPDDRADYLNIVGVNAARLGDLPRARRSFTRSLRARRDARTVVRLVAAWLPPLARMLWRPVPDEVGRRTAGQSLTAVADAASDRPDVDRLFLPWRYRENPPASADAGGTPFWTPEHHHDDRNQVPVYRWAAQLARDPRHHPVVDIGCGSGRKLVRHVGAVTDQHVGVDQPSGIALARSHAPDSRWVEGDLDDDRTWDQVRSLGPGLVICSDVIEHVADPRALLSRLRDLAAGAPILLSTPDRSRLEGVDPLGPPRNPAHVREWTPDELELLCESVGLGVVRRRALLPRSYSPTRTDLNRTVYRALHLRPLPDRRSCQALLLRAR